MKRGKCGDKLHLQWIQTVSVTLSLPSLEVHISHLSEYTQLVLHTRIEFGGSLGGLDSLFRASGLTEVISFGNFEPHIMFPPFSSLHLLGTQGNKNPPWSPSMHTLHQIRGSNKNIEP